MLLTDARRPARTAPDGVSLVPLAEQDRSRWDRAMIDEGAALVTAALAQGSTGPYQLQAAIAAVHDEAETMDDTDWPQILGLYDLLELAAPNPFTTLSRAVAAGLVHGPRAGLDLLDTLQQDKRMANHHRLLAARAHLLELAGQAGRGGEGLRPGGPAVHQRTRTPVPRHPGAAARLRGRADAVMRWALRRARAGPDQPASVSCAPWASALTGSCGPNGHQRSDLAAPKASTVS